MRELRPPGGAAAVRDVLRVRLPRATQRHRRPVRLHPTPHPAAAAGHDQQEDEVAAQEATGESPHHPRRRHLRPLLVARAHPPPRRLLRPPAPVGRVPGRQRHVELSRLLQLVRQPHHLQLRVAGVPRALPQGAQLSARRQGQHQSDGRHDGGDTRGDPRQRHPVDDIDEVSGG